MFPKMNPMFRSIADAPWMKDYKNLKSDYNYLIYNPVSDDKIKLDEVLVSIITISRNSEATIEDTIKSVINQDYKNIEYIIIDCCSTDKTLEIISYYEKNISYCVSEFDQGISDAFNKGISIASGKIIGIINSDDWYEESTIREVVRTYVLTDAKIMHGKLRRWMADEKTEISDSDESKLHLESSVNHPTVFVDKDIYERFGLFNLDFKYAMDYEWFLRIKKIDASIKFVYLDSVLANMRLTGISSKQWKKANKEVLKAKNIYEFHLFNNAYFYYKIIKGTISSFLLKTPLSWMVAYYRRNFSIVKKYSR